jgi:hypothetical protein
METPCRQTSHYLNQTSPCRQTPGYNEKPSYLKTDENRIINEIHIRWVKKMSECLDVCTKSVGCAVENGDLHRICKINNPYSYNKLNQYFE